MNDRDTRQTANLPVWNTLRAAHALVFGRPGDFVALAMIPLAISIAGETFILFDPTGTIAAVAENTGVGTAHGLKLSFSFLTTYIPWTVFVVAWHRFVLLGKRDTRRPVEYYFGTREVNIFSSDLFLVYLAPGCMIVFLIVSLLVLNFPPDLHEARARGNIITLMFFALLMVRFLFGDPATAVGHETGILTAWKQSKGVAWKLFWILFLAALPFAFLHLLMESPGTAVVAEPGVAAPEHVTVGDHLVTIAQGLVLFIGTAVIVAALCLSYQHAVIGSDQAKAEPISLSEWMVHFVLPVILGLVLGLAGFSIAEFLDLPVREQFALAAAAFLIPLALKIYQFVRSAEE